MTTKSETVNPTKEMREERKAKAHRNDVRYKQEEAACWEEFYDLDFTGNFFDLDFTKGKRDGS